LLIESSGQIQEKQFGIGWWKIWRKIFLEKDALTQKLIMRFFHLKTLYYSSASSTVVTAATVPFTELDSSGLSTIKRMLKGARVMPIRNLSVQEKTCEWLSGFGLKLSFKRSIC